jgi:hypothetical protein
MPEEEEEEGNTEFTRRETPSKFVQTSLHLFSGASFFFFFCGLGGSVLVQVHAVGENRDAKYKRKEREDSRTARTART